MIRCDACSRRFPDACARCPRCGARVHSGRNWTALNIVLVLMIALGLGVLAGSLDINLPPIQESWPYLALCALIGIGVQLARISAKL